MTIKNLYLSIGGDYADITEIQSIEVNETFGQPCARFSLETRDTGSFDLNDAITITVGYTGDTGEIFQGYIDEIKSTRRPGTYEITGRDVLKRAIEHWIVTTDLDNPWSRRNISAENLVRDLLAEAGITDYSGETSNFTFGVSGPAEFQLVSVWDSIHKIMNILAWTCYAENGTVYFSSLQPAPSGSPSSTLVVGNDGDIEQINYEYSTENLRNKVVVFGKDGIYAEASAVSPYLPPDFYKTAIVSSELIDLQSMADQAATYNLNLYNKLTEVTRVDIEGRAGIRARQTITVTEPFTGINSDWFVYSVTHRLDESGYVTTLHLIK